MIGLGYIGLPLSISFAKAGFNVFGIDIDNSKIQSLHEQNSYISDVSDKELKNTIKNYKITFTSTYSPIIKSDVVIICVPTPLNKTKDPDISYIVISTLLLFGISYYLFLNKLFLYNRLKALY